MKHVCFIEIDLDSVQRGGTTRIGACVCGWRGPQRGTLEMAYDDTSSHEKRENAPGKHAPRLVRGPTGFPSLRCACGETPPASRSAEMWLLDHLTSHGVHIHRLDT